MDATERMAVIRELCSFEGRLAGTDAERRAANRLAARLRSARGRCEVEPIHVHPQVALVHAIHCVVGFGGSLAAVASPPLGFGLVLLAATSMYLDLHGRVYLLRRLFFRRASQNVVSPGGRADAPARLVLCAHYDAPRTGTVFAPGRARLAARASRLLRVPVGPFRVLFWSLAVLLPLSAARAAGLDAGPIAFAQLAPTLVLLVGAFALVDIQLSDPVPGASDNASGVAAVLSLAAELDRERPANLDVWVLLTGGGECMGEGMRSHLRSHRRELDRERTFFLALDTLGHGEVRFEESAGWAVSFNMDRRLVELAGAVADADEALGAEPLRSGIAGESLPPRVRRFRSLGITCRGPEGNAPHRHLPSDTPEAIDPQALGRAHAFTLELIRLLDRDLGREAQASG